jgi:alkylated DNA repair dioxygenase AlkB
MKQEADQAIINEYQPGQGISPHVDCVPCFGPVVAAISLGSDCVMDFTHPEDGTKVAVHLTREAVRHDGTRPVHLAPQHRRP